MKKRVVEILIKLKIEKIDIFFIGLFLKEDKLRNCGVYKNKNKVSRFAIKTQKIFQIC